MQLRRKVGVVLSVATLSAGISGVAAFSGETAAPPPCSGDRPCEDKLIIVTRDGLKCAIYQSGGPNSSRLWCSEGSAADEGTPR